jgi:pimeloyl-ACP methyl ester carboxylesterase
VKNLPLYGGGYLAHCGTRALIADISVFKELFPMSIQPVDGFIPANGLQLHYRRWSPLEPESNLPHIFLLHGLASAAHIWDLVAPLLVAHGYVVTALDQRGHGESEKPDSGYDFDTIVADDAGAVEALHIVRPIIVGHSWGALVALQYAAVYAEQVAALVMVDGGVGQLSLRPRFAGTPRDTFLSYVKSGPLGQQWTPQLEDIMLHIVQLRDDGTVAPRLHFENHLQIIGAMWDQPTYDLYQQLRCPTALILAEQKPTSATQEAFFRMRAEGLAYIQQLRPDIRVVRMPDTIHDIPLQRPAELAEEIVRDTPSLL